jgi:uncharacterized protein (TIGR02145 family)
MSNMDAVPTESNGCIYDTLEEGNCSFSIDLDHLTPGTTYYVRAFMDESNYGNIVKFTTTGSVTGNIVFNPDLSYGSLTDRDGNIYKTVKIGSQTWMAENLKTSKYNDGTDIPLITEMSYWRGRSTPAYCWYLNDESKYKNPYGAIYNWHTVHTGKLCPTGWHVPNSEEWTTLSSYLGGDSVADGQLREAGTTHWIRNNTGVTNSSGFTALPGGFRASLLTVWPYPDIDDFGNLGYSGAFWSTDTTLTNLLGQPPIQGDNFYFNDANACGISYNHKFDGLSVRCLKD